LQYTDSANEDESEEDTSIPTSETGVVAVEGDDGQQYVVLEVIQLDGQDQIDNYTSTSVSIQQVDQSSCKYKFKFSLILVLKINYLFNSSKSKRPYNFKNSVFVRRKRGMW